MSRHAAPPGAIRWATIGASVILLTAFGCDSGTASVSGTVKFKGELLHSGTVLFHGADGRVEHSLIDENGSYAIAEAPLGAVRITVQSHPPLPAKLPLRGGKPPNAPADIAPRDKDYGDGKYVTIPPQYLDPAKSGLVYTVRRGTQTHDINLEP